MCDRCHDTAHANLRLGFGATGLWDLGPLALGSWLLGCWPACGFKFLCIMLFECLWVSSLCSLQFESTETRAQAADLRSHPLKRCCPC